MGGGLALAAFVLVGLLFWWFRLASPSSTLQGDALVVAAFANAHGTRRSMPLATGLARDVHRELRRMRVTVRGGVTAGGSRVLEASVIAREEAADAVITALSDLRCPPGRFDLAVRVLAASGAEAWTRNYGASEEELPGLARRVAEDLADAVGV